MTIFCPKTLLVFLSQGWIPYIGRILGAASRINKKRVIHRRLNAAAEPDRTLIHQSDC